MSSLVAMVLAAALAQAPSSPAAPAGDAASSVAPTPSVGTTIKESRPEEPLRIRVKLAKGTMPSTPGRL